MKPLFVLASVFYPVFTFASGSACVIAFGESELVARKRAERFVAHKPSQLMTYTLAQSVMSTNAVVSLGSVDDPATTEVGTITEVDPTGFVFLNRLGLRRPVVFADHPTSFDIETPEARERRVLGLTGIAPRESRRLIEQVQWAFVDRSVVEVRIKSGKKKRGSARIFTGRVHLVDVREIWERDKQGLMRRPAWAGTGSFTEEQNRSDFQFRSRLT